MIRHGLSIITVSIIVFVSCSIIIGLTVAKPTAEPPKEETRIFNNINNKNETTVIGDDERGGKSNIRMPFKHSSLNNATFFRNLKHKPSRTELREERHRMSERMKKRRENARLKLQEVAAEYNPDPENVKKLSMDEINKAKNNPDDHPWVRRVAWGSNSNNDGGGASLVDPSEEYDMWSQAYRFLGGYIDCDYDKDGDDNHSGDNNDEDDGEGGNACSRWMIWAAYVNPNYQGNGYDEYYGDSPVSSLDCHDSSSDWELLGVYRQEFYQYIEQISKHLWAIDEYEYCVALAGLSYMTDYECYQVGNDNSGNAIYASVQPTSYGRFQMGLYTSDYCLEPDDSLGMTYDDFGLTTDVQVEGSGDGGGDGDDDAYTDNTEEWWYGTQEYTLTQLNEVYDRFRYCTSCVDFPTYQDGYFIGDYGTDDDDLINQCWKFWSHDSFTCGSDCLGKANAQNTILSIDYGGATWGETPAGWFSQTNGEDGIVTKAESRLSRLLANVFVTISFVVFVATFLAFAVARRSRYRESRSSKARRLLDDGHRSSRSRRSSSRRRKSKDRDGDGIWKDSSSKSRKSSKSRSSKSRSKSRSRKTSSENADGTDGDGHYRPPSTSAGGEDRERRSSSSRKLKESSQSENHNDEF